MSLELQYIFKKKGRFYYIFIDFAKAFDSIDHEKLWNAFTRKNIDAKSFNMFQPVYSKLKSCVQIDDMLTQYFKCSIGTRQGCVASPIFFSLFINDLITYVRDYCGGGIIVSNEIDKLHTLLFADDVAEFSESRKENPQKLTQLSSRSHPRHLVGTKTAQKDTTRDTTSDSQMNSNFPYRWSAASLTFNNYFYLF